MKLSNCCGVQGFIKKFDNRLSGENYYDSEEAGICPKCGEHCEYIEPCDECGGDGEIEINTARGEEGMMIEMDIMVVCPECNGKKTKNIYE